MPALAAGAPADRVDLDAVLSRAGVYVSKFMREFSNVVAEERYVQQASGRQTLSGAGRQASAAVTGGERRELLSDFLLVKLPDVNYWVPFRDVFEVDGKPVREREDRLTKLLLKPTSQSDNQVKAIIVESSRYNIGDVERTINMPLLTLGFLALDQQLRFRFSLGKEDPSVGPGVVIVDYEERERPTVVRTPDGRNLFASGRIWIEEESGRVTKTEIVFQDATLRATVTTSFRTDERFHLGVPAEMVEDYTLRNRSHVTGRASYGRFRRFDVTSTEDIPLPDPGTPPLK